MRAIGCFSPILTLKEKNSVFFQVILFFVEYKPMKIQHDSTTFSLDVTWAQKLLSYSFPSAFSNSKDKWMPIKNQLPTLSKLYSIYEEIPEDSLDETGIDSYFNHRMLHITKKEIVSFASEKHRTKIPSNLQFFYSTAPQYTKKVPWAKNLLWQDENWE